ncbi:MAG: hypothetical protein HY818_02485 [Acetobacterium woodii]|nr:hypothetical protein [Acetobacterium woodii]
MSKYGLLLLVTTHEKGILIMLDTWRFYNYYQRFGMKNLASLARTDPHTLFEHEKIISSLIFSILILFDIVKQSRAKRLSAITRTGFRIPMPPGSG